MCRSPKKVTFSISPHSQFASRVTLQDASPTSYAKQTTCRDKVAHPSIPWQKSCSEQVVLSASSPAISGTFNSLSKVLFTFPSRYFFAIGRRVRVERLEEITTPFALHFQRARLQYSAPYADNLARNGSLTLSAALFQSTLRAKIRRQQLSRLQIGEHPVSMLALSPVHSPLLGESYLFCSPPLTYMLKFSG